ncbi:MAG TPA: sensor histidine kinase [Rhodanobacteraceae bacterium]|nr:sensor histidine kinase [Rhodanobacteraceae bacterium]
MNESRETIAAGATGSRRGSLAATLRGVRRRILPQHLDDLGWAPVWSLLYLGFLFMTWDDPASNWLRPTLVSIAIFLPLYFRCYWLTGWKQLAHVGALASLAFALVPFNKCAHTYLIYAAIFLPFSGLPLRTSLLLILGGLALYTGELALLNVPGRAIVIIIGVTLIVSVAVCAANTAHREKRLRQSELKLSHDEIRRLAALAERERIGRDLHDLLGHTLSLITLKSELAVRLFDRDPLGARREIVDVERVARDALGQVRRAVTGIRAAGIAAELASAHLLLESGGVCLEYEALDGSVLPPDIETIFALMIREGVTNIQRHARASQARVSLAVAEREVRLVIEDNGRGGVIAPGNGLTGMRERLRALDGDLVIASERGRGTRLEACVILPASIADAMPVSGRTARE